jgi:hypothetical protein
MNKFPATSTVNAVGDAIETLAAVTVNSELTAPGVISMILLFEESAINKSPTPFSAAPVTEPKL